MIMQNYACMGVITVLWFLIGFSLCFGESAGGFIGNPGSFGAFINVEGTPLTYNKNDPDAAIVGDLPGLAFAGYQGMFAVVCIARRSNSHHGMPPHAISHVIISHGLDLVVIWHATPCHFSCDHLAWARSRCYRLRPPS